ARGGVGLFSHHLPEEPIERCDPATGFGTAEVVRPTSAAAADVERGQIGECPSALVGVLDPLPARARSRRERLVDPSARLDRWLLIGADHELAWMEQLAAAEAAQTPRWITSRCSSEREKRDSGRPCSRGSEQAIAFTSAICSGG